MNPLGIYVSIPFCRSKCSYCNFASGVFSADKMSGYAGQVAREIASADQYFAALEAGDLPAACDSVYLGGGTPSTLPGELFALVFRSLRTRFRIAEDAEITVECAPGTISDDLRATMVRMGVNRVSFGVQSFADRETSAVGRLHSRIQALEDIARVRAAGIEDINLDLIAGLPHQTAASWRSSVDQAIAEGVPHVSLYMLEVDQDSRLGSELMAGGSRYHAHFVPDDDLIADLYLEGCERLAAAGLAQYEISNFARPGRESRHNLKYWTRQPYLGFGLDAHSMVPAKIPSDEFAVVRTARPDELDSYLNGKTPEPARISQRQALEEEFFLGLRLNCGVDLSSIKSLFMPAMFEEASAAIPPLIAEGLLEATAHGVRLTPRGRLLSNEVFARFIDRSA